MGRRLKKNERPAPKTCQWTGARYLLAVKRCEAGLADAKSGFMQRGEVKANPDRVPRDPAMT
jgi:hypothetical protein